MNAVPIDENAWKSFEDDLLNPSVSLQDRFKILFTLKHLATDRSVEIISKAFVDKSALLKHELAYVLGQMRLSSALPKLMEILENKSEDPMVRHEAAEAMGAIGDLSSFDVLCKYATDENDHVSVRETCILALDRLKRIENKTHPDHDALVSAPALPFASVDPAVPIKSAPSFEDIPLLEATLNNESATLYERYAAMFGLRNAGVMGQITCEKTSLAAVKALCDSLISDETSALFRHEIAYVLGQRQHPASAAALEEVLGRSAELSMVRHECAEALGAIATDIALKALEKFINDPDDVVRESCLIALDILEHEQSSELLYVDGLIKVHKTAKEMKEAISMS